VVVRLQERHDIVDAVLLVLAEDVEEKPGKPALVAARLGEHRHVGRQSATGHLARLRVVLERRRETVGRPAGAFHRLALVIGVLDLVFGRDRLDLPRTESGTARLREIAEGQELEAVTVLADLTIDLEAALELRAVEFAERAGERP